MEAVRLFLCTIENYRCDCLDVYIVTISNQHGTKFREICRPRFEGPLLSLRVRFLLLPFTFLHWSVPLPTFLTSPPASPAMIRSSSTMAFCEGREIWQHLHKIQGRDELVQAKVHTPDAIFL